MRTSRGYLVALLTVILAFNYVDRLVLGVVAQEIKTELHLSDTQLGVLTGIAFAAFYSIMGIPIARWADRGNRVTIISLTVGLWSATVALCGAATSYLQLLLIRVGVAVGEAGCYPSGLSLIADHFSRVDLPRAVARFMLGIPIALVIGNFSAGWLNELYGWRTTFVLIGIPGLMLAALAASTLKEPRTQRKHSVPDTHSAQSDSAAGARLSPGLKGVFVTLWCNPAFRNLWLCFSVWGFFGYGLTQWLPTFFLRSHGLQTGELGTMLAVVYGIGGICGTWLGGELASRFAPNNERLQLRAIAVVYGLLAFLTAGVFLASSYQWAFVILGASSVSAAATNGPLFAATQTLVPPRMRAMAIALIYFFCNLIGMGLGPLAVGALSDALHPELGEESLRYALLVFSPGYLWCAWHLWKASRTVTHDVAAAQEQGSALVRGEA